MAPTARKRRVRAVAAERVELHRALEDAVERVFSAFGGARFERRSDLLVVLLPGVPIPQFNGAWVCEDSEAAAAVLPRRSQRLRLPASRRGCRRGTVTSGRGRQPSRSA